MERLVYLDTCASKHISPNASRFTSLDRASTTALLGTTHVNLSQTKGQGTIHLHTETACLDLQEVLYTTQLHHTLLALRKTTINGARVILEPDGSIEINKQGKVIATGFRTHNHLHQLHESQLRADEMSLDKRQQAVALLTEAEVWQECFCHLGYPNLRRLTSRMRGMHTLQTREVHCQ